MKKSVLLPALAVLGGGAGFFLRRWQLVQALDPETNLFRHGVPATCALLALGAALAVAFLLLIQGAKPPRDYAQAFHCPSSFYMAVMAAGGFLILASAGLGLLELREAMALWQATRIVQQGAAILPIMLFLAVLLCIPSGIAMLLLARGNYRNSLPTYHAALATFPAYAALPWLVAVYQQYSRDPVLLRFADILLGITCSVLALYYAASFAFHRPRPRCGLFFSLMAISLNLESLANGQTRFFTLLSISITLCLVAQSWALARSCFGPPWPRRLLEERMPDKTDQPSVAPDPTEDNQEEPEHG